MNLSQAIGKLLNRSPKVAIEPSAPEKAAASGAAAPRSQGEPPAVIEPKFKVTPFGQAMPSHFARAKPSGREQRITETDRRIAVTDLLSFRNAGSTKELIRQLASTSPDVSASVYAYIRMVVTHGYSAVARGQDGKVDIKATQALQMLLTRFDYLAGYSDKFSSTKSIHALAESMAKELRIEGACSLELTLDKARLPWALQGISVTQVKFVDDGSTRNIKPIQVVGSDEISLDYPTFFYEALDQDLTKAYSDSPMEAGVQATMSDAEFHNDMRRIIKRALHPRLTAIIQSAEFIKSLPGEIQGDAEKLAEYQSNLIASIQREIDDLDPDDALVAFDTVKFDYMSRGNESLGREYETLQNINNARMASGTKAPGSVLGHASGSQNVASTESMLFVKYCQGIQLKVNNILSRALTLAIRLLGHDCYVEFKFDQIDLRPDSELEAYRAMKQSRVLELLSIGMIADEEAALELTGLLPREGAPKLSGTFFKTGAAQTFANPDSNTSALNQTLTPDTPDQPKGAPLRRVQ